MDIEVVLHVILIVLGDRGVVLSEDNTEEDLENIFEDPGLVPDDLFYSFYYYSGIVLSQVPDILDQYGKFPEESKKLRAVISSRG